MHGIWSRLPKAAVILTVGLAACSSKSDTAAKAQQPAGALPPGHPAITSAPAAQATQTPPAVVAETMDAGGYTYARLTGPDGKDVWAAGPQTKLSVGDTVIMDRPIAMTSFTSKTLNRTFDRIYFASAFMTPAEAKSAVAAAPQAMAGAPSSGATAGPSVGSGVVQQVMDGGGYTYLQVKSGDQLVWLAAPQTKIDKGQTVSWNGAMAMHQFQSPSLKRTFDEILFVPGVKVGS
jgi:hypothetical protein